MPGLWANSRYEACNSRNGPNDWVAREVYGYVTARSTPRPGEVTLDRQKRIASSDALFEEALRRLSNLVVAPLGDLTAVTRLLIVADGALQYVPFGMLSGRSNDGLFRPLIVDYEIVTMPSASVLSVQREQTKARESRPSGIAVIADPVFDRSDPRLARSPLIATPQQGAAFDATRILEHLGRPATPKSDAVEPQSIIPRLPFTRNEADAILAVARGQKNFRATGFAASKEAVLGGALKDYRIIHFATHGFFDTERPTLSSIVLSLVDRNGTPLTASCGRRNSITSISTPTSSY